MVQDATFCKCYALLACIVKALRVTMMEEEYRMEQYRVKTCLGRDRVYTSSNWKIGVSISEWLTKYYAMA